MLWMYAFLVAEYVAAVAQKPGWIVVFMALCFGVGAEAKLQGRW